MVDEGGAGVEVKEEVEVVPFCHLSIVKKYFANIPRVRREPELKIERRVKKVSKSEQAITLLEDSMC